MEKSQNVQFQQEKIKMIKKLNERIEEELEEQFPKGDNARGRALVLHSIAQIEFDDLQKAFNIALEENNKLRAKIAVLTGEKDGKN